MDFERADFRLLKKIVRYPGNLLLRVLGSINTGYFLRDIF